MTDGQKCANLGPHRNPQTCFLSSALAHLQLHPPMFPSVPVLYLSLPVLHEKEEWVDLRLEPVFSTRSSSTASGVPQSSAVNAAPNG